eukprot:TRINITY_DN1668_c0_g1_i1.p1 TRINITY_DN1668_c0_g1~~TRINITY_DN1668_c0_g1_i1.p1  ORF type:complete len:242 (-),score=97.75 TRINITY_DN1668_c0_g1_i1:18-743(-)
MQRGLVGLEMCIRDRNSMNQNDDENALPKTTIINIVKEQLGDKFKLSGSTIDLILKLSQEFAYKLADEANNLCITQGKKTINNTHVLGALKSLGISEYVEKLGSLYDCELDVNAKEEDIAAKMQFRKKKKKQKSAEVNADLLQEQERLFNDAKMADLFMEGQSPAENINIPALNSLPIIQGSKVIPQEGSNKGQDNNSKDLMNELDKKLGEKASTAIDNICLLYTSPSPRDLSTSRMPSSA